MLKIADKPPKKIIRVQLIDPHPITLLGIAHLVASNSQIEICGSSSNSVEALALAATAKPDIIVLEPDFQEENGLELIPTLLKLTKAKIVICTGRSSPKLYDQAILKGARGVVNKADPADNLVRAIEKIYEGELFLNRNATSRIMLQIAQANSPKGLGTEQKRLLTLTTKEEKVTRAIQVHSAKTLKQVAESLHISEHTLRNHLASIYGKLGVRNRMALYVFCGKYQKTDNPAHHPKRRSTDI